MKFKIGDIVRYLGNTSNDIFITPGAIGTILKIQNSSGYEILCEWTATPSKDKIWWIDKTAIVKVDLSIFNELGD